MEYCHFSWNDAWDVPVTYRKWMIARKQKELDKKREMEEKARGKAPHHPAPKPQVRPKQKK